MAIYAFYYINRINHILRTTSESFEVMQYRFEMFQAEVSWRLFVEVLVQQLYASLQYHSATILCHTWERMTSHGMGFGYDWFSVSIKSLNKQLSIYLSSSVANNVKKMRKGMSVQAMTILRLNFIVCNCRIAYIFLFCISDIKRSSVP